MAWAGVAVGIAGLALQGAGAAGASADAKKIARQKRAAAEFEAAQLEQQAGQEIAASHRALYGEDRNMKLVQSRALTLAAASGGGASDPTVLNIISGIASEGAYRKSLALYQGEEAARKLRIGAQATRLSGEIGAAASLAQGRAIATQAAGSILSGAGSMYARYGYDSPAVAQPTPLSQLPSGYDSAGGPAYG